MKAVTKLVASIVLLTAAGAATAAVTVSPPVALNSPVSGVTRQVWCVAQNVSYRTLTANSQLIQGWDNGTAQEITADVPPLQTVWLAGVSGGSGLVYCRFDKIGNTNKLRTFIVVQDNNATSQVYPAK